MKNPSISILVPICNVEKYLNKCLQSLVDQTISNIEIVCINDGSKDSSLNIIQKFADKDKRIIVIDKVNTGYGDSMNRGLEIAKGEYIGIVESDDCAEPEMFKELYELAKKYDADVVKSNFNFYWENPEKKVFENNLGISEVVYNSVNANESIFWGLPAIWSAIYKKDWLERNNIRFLPTPGASYQDTSFNFKVACAARKIVLTNKAYLNYRQDNINSSVKNTSLEKVHMLHKEWDEAERYMHAQGLDKYKMYFETLKFNGLMWNYLRISPNDRIDYFREISSCFNDRSLIDVNHIRKYNKYGGLYALIHKKKWLLDLMIAIRSIIQNEK